MGLPGRPLVGGAAVQASDTRTPAGVSCGVVNVAESWRGHRHFPACGWGWRVHAYANAWQRAAGPDSLVSFCRAALASAHQGQPLPKSLSVLEGTPQVRGMHTIIRY